jgi:uncharacterized LabA/DUF88 family protein
MPRVHAYVDGFNLYHRAIKQHPGLKWLDVTALVRRLIRDDDELVRLRYYTSRVAGRTDDGQPARQEAYIRALAGIPCLTIHFGNFASRPVCRPLVETFPLVHPKVDGMQYVMIHNTEEKASDVSLASHLLWDGFTDQYDAAVIVSSDTDLVEPLRIVKDEIRRPVVLLYPDLERRSVPKKLARVCTTIRFINKKDLVCCQLPNPARARNGCLLSKPVEWRIPEPAVHST